MGFFAPIASRPNCFSITNSSILNLIVFRLQTGVVYVPDIKPGPSSLLSQQAYRDGRIAPPPHLDPAGWLTLPKVLIRGRLLGHDVGLECLVRALLHLDNHSPTYDQFKITAVSCKSRAPFFGSSPTNQPLTPPFFQSNATRGAP